MGEWLSLMEFATRNGVSLSTLRRQIKSGKVQHRSESGKYFIWDGEALARHGMDSSDSELKPRVAELEAQLKKAREEIAELKTLLAFYEEQPQGSHYTV